MNCSQYVKWYILAVYVLILTATNFEFFVRGFNFAKIQTPGDIAFARDCAERIHIPERVPDACERYRSQTWFQPIFSGFDSVAKNGSLCLLMPCSKLYKEFVDITGSFFIVIIIAGVVAIILMSFLSRLLPSPSNAMQTQRSLRGGEDGGGLNRNSNFMINSDNNDDDEDDNNNVSYVSSSIWSSAPRPSRLRLVEQKES